MPHPSHGLKRPIEEERKTWYNPFMASKALPLKERVALITGGSSGIGLAIARAVLADGMAVAIAAREPKRLKRAAAELSARSSAASKDRGAAVLAVPADVAKARDVELMVQQTIERFGRIDLLVNNAGTYREGDIDELDEAEWDEVQAVNLKGAFLCTKAVLPAMKRQRAGYIVNIASLAGKTGFGGASAYSASKFGVIGLTESTLEEGVGHGIRATAICPGYVATPMVAGASVPASDMIPPEDIGRLVIGLLSLAPVTVIKEIVVQRLGAIGS
ncbi:MAG TPA: SDR family NAD(P)-dependent oxidoreductase [Nitrospiria bacterium]|nr:SDR family NAD(P)-dependent oxidoreductase [Nitrospiria bacterium]